MSSCNFATKNSNRIPLEHTSGIHSSSKASFTDADFKREELEWKRSRAIVEDEYRRAEDEYRRNQADRDDAWRRSRAIAEDESRRAEAEFKHSRAIAEDEYRRGEAESRRAEAESRRNQADRDDAWKRKQFKWETEGRRLEDLKFTLLKTALVIFLIVFSPLLKKQFDGTLDAVQSSVERFRRRPKEHEVAHNKYLQRIQDFISSPLHLSLFVSGVRRSGKTWDTKQIMEILGEKVGTEVLKIEVPPHAGITDVVQAVQKVVNQYTLDFDESVRILTTSSANLKDAGITSLDRLFALLSKQIKRASDKKKFLIVFDDLEHFMYNEESFKIAQFVLKKLNRLAADHDNVFPIIISSDSCAAFDVNEPMEYEVVDQLEKEDAVKFVRKQLKKKNLDVEMIDHILAEVGRLVGDLREVCDRLNGMAFYNRDTIDELARIIIGRKKVELNKAMENISLSFKIRESLCQE